MRTPRGALVLFTRDLRVHDHEALSAAMRECEVVVPAFVLDRELLAGGCRAPNRLAFLLQSLTDLDRSLRERGARLIVLRGDVVEQALKLVHECSLSAIHMSADFTPYAQKRHRRLRHACETARVELRVHPGVTVVRPGEITPAAGDHYRVFTPYWRVWSPIDPGPAKRAPRRIAMGDVRRAGSIPKLSSLVRDAPSPELQSGGESAARAHLTRWLREGAARYEQVRHELARETSRLSAYLHFGCLSPREVLQRSARGPTAASFARQLCWRDFHHQVLAARPELPSRDSRSRGDRWFRDERSLEAWRTG
ncbi:MAG: deoxyribodipyrimidine photo-lyase, partial [Solirubrobacteraceae bacterium]